MTKILPSALLVCAFTLTSYSSAASVLTLGSNAELHVKSSAEYRYESNIFRDEEGFQVAGTGPVSGGGNGINIGETLTIEEESDNIFVFSPGVELVVGDVATNYFNASFGYDIKRYADNSRLDSNLPSVSAEGFFNNQVVQLKSNLSWLESDSSTSDILDANLVGRLIEREQFSFNNYGEYFFSTKTSFGAGFDYLERDFITPGFSNNYHYAVPIDVYYAVTPKIDASLGYRYRRVHISDNPIIDRDQGAAFNDHFINVGVRGEITPKLTSRVQLGYIDRSFARIDGPPRSGDEEGGNISIFSNLAYQYSPKIQMNLATGRDFDASSSDGTTIVRTRIRLGVLYAYNQMWAGRANFGYAKSNYQGSANNREDDYFDIGVSVLYSPNDYLRFSAGYTYLDNDSSFTGLSYNNNLFRITGTFRY